MSRTKATKQWRGRALIDELAAQGIIIRSPSMRGVAEEAPAAYKDVSAVVDIADRAGLARKVAQTGTGDLHKRLKQCLSFISAQRLELSALEKLFFTTEPRKKTG